MNKFKISEFIVTFFYLGKIKYCPGTFGSMAAYVLAAAVIYLSERFLFSLSEPSDALIVNFYIFGIPIILSLLLILLFLAGVYYSNIYIKYKTIKDPKEIVIDEVVGQLLTLILCIPGLIILYTIYGKTFKHFFLFSYLPPFILFRLYDIFKPWPINYIDQNVKSGLGIMLDDILAAIFAAITTYIVIFILI